MVTGLSLLLMVTGLYLSITGHDGPAGTKSFCITVGILGWWCGIKLGELEERLDDLCSQKPSSAASATEPSAELKSRS